MHGQQNKKKETNILCIAGHLFNFSEPSSFNMKDFGLSFYFSTRTVHCQCV